VKDIIEDIASVLLIMAAGGVALMFIGLALR
jgi:hypothetical protein